MGITKEQIRKEGFHPYANGEIDEIAATLSHYSKDAKEIRIYRFSELEPPGEENKWLLCIKE